MSRLRLKNEVRVEEVGLEKIVEINNKIPEFDGEKLNFFEDRLRDKLHVSLLATINKQEAGYLVAYEKNKQKKEIYCWMAAVIPKFRRSGILSKLFEEVLAWADKNNFEKITIKTRNKRREMLHFLVKKGFIFEEVIKKDDPLENRIILSMKI